MRYNHNKLTIFAQNLLEYHKLGLNPALHAAQSNNIFSSLKTKAPQT